MSVFRIIAPSRLGRIAPGPASNHARLECPMAAERSDRPPCIRQNITDRGSDLSKGCEQGPKRAPTCRRPGVALSAQDLPSPICRATLVRSGSPVRAQPCRTPNGAPPEAPLRSIRGAKGPLTLPKTVTSCRPPGGSDPELTLRNDTGDCAVFDMNPVAGSKSGCALLNHRHQLASAIEAMGLGRS